ncbi:hypothetical protein D3C78_1676490 [compost metagenome]
MPVAIKNQPKARLSMAREKVTARPMSSCLSSGPAMRAWTATTMIMIAAIRIMAPSKPAEK